MSKPDYRTQMKEAGITKADFGKVIPRSEATAFANVPENYKPIGIKELAMKMLEAERAKGKKDIPTGDNGSAELTPINDKNPSKVEDKVKAEKDLPNKKESTILPPTGAKKLNVDAQSKQATPKNIKLAGLVPATVKRTKEEVPSIKEKGPSQEEQEDMVPAKENNNTKKTKVTI
jgi:hypothetical protein